MFELLFGLVWSVITAIVTGMFAMVGAMSNGKPFGEHAVFLYIILGVFWVIGIAMIIKGILSLLKDKITDIKGEECFGKVCKVYESGAYVNGQPQFKAKSVIYIESLNTTKYSAEVIGFDETKYPIGSFVKVKCYKNDINYIEVVDEKIIPLHIKDELNKMSKNIEDISTMKEDDTEDPNVVVIDGVEYIKRIEYVRKDEITLK